MPLTQPGGRGAIDGTVCNERDAVIVLGGIARDQPVGDVERDLLGIAFGGVPETAAARQFEPDEVAARHALPAFGADRLAGNESYPTERALAASVPAARWCPRR